MAVSAIDASVGGVTANSYVTSAEATTYFDNRLANDTWKNSGSDDQKRALIMAAQILDTRVVWKGWKASEQQALQWPRYGVLDSLSGFGGEFVGDEIPTQVKHAQLEMALGILADSSRIEDQNKGLKSLKAGSVELEFDHGSTAAPQVLPRAVRDLVQSICESIVGDTGGFSVKSLVRA